MQLPKGMEDQYASFRQHIQQAHDLDAKEDLDMDAQLENVSSERGNSSLQMSIRKNLLQAAQATSYKSAHISDSIPPTLQYRNLWKMLRRAKPQSDERQWTTRPHPHPKLQVSTPHSPPTQGLNVYPYWPLVCLAKCG